MLSKHSVADGKDTNMVQMLENIFFIKENIKQKSKPAQKLILKEDFLYFLYIS